MRCVTWGKRVVTRMLWVKLVAADLRFGSAWNVFAKASDVTGRDSGFTWKGVSMTYEVVGVT